jgi:hypothetical protein
LGLRLKTGRRVNPRQEETRGGMAAEAEFVRCRRRDAEGHPMQRLRRLAGAVALSLSVVAAASAQSQHEAERHIRRHAEVGETVRLRGHVNYHLCDTVIPTTIVVVNAPSHGTLAVHDEIVKSTNPELGRGDKCQGNSGMGRVVYYTRTTPGTDVFRYDSTSDNGVVHIDVTVD